MCNYKDYYRYFNNLLWKCSTCANIWQRGWLVFWYMNFSASKCNLPNLQTYLIVYSSVPSSWIRRSLFGIVMLWATDFFPLWKKVSGVQILLAIKLLSRRIFIGPLNFNLSSFHFCRKKTSIVYSWNIK